MDIPADILGLVTGDPPVTRWGIAPHPNRISETWWYACWGGADPTVIERRLKKNGWPEAFYEADRTVYLRPAAPLECRDDEMHALGLVRRLHARLQRLTSHLRNEAADIEALLARLP